MVPAVVHVVVHHTLLITMADLGTTVDLHTMDHLTTGVQVDIMGREDITGRVAGEDSS